MLHRNAKLTPAGRRLLVDRIASGRPVAHVAAEGVARQTAHRWWRRFVAEGESGLQDRSCRPRRSPRRTPRALERRIERLRRRQKLGPVRIGYRLGLAASTVYRVLCRLGLQRLSWLDRPTGRVIRRYEHPHPGDLLHMDIKKLGRIPPGGGWRAHGRGRAGARQRVGYAYIHSAVDDHSRLAYSEVLADERAVTVVAFWRRALAWFADRGVTAQAVLTDNGSAYRSADFARACLAAGIRHRRTRPYRPQTNGKVERFNRTLLEEWAYVRVYRSEQARTAALARWLHHYNHHRGHTALGGLPPVSRVTNSRDSTASAGGEAAVPEALPAFRDQCAHRLSMAAPLPGAGTVRSRQPLLPPEAQPAPDTTTGRGGRALTSRPAPPLGRTQARRAVAGTRARRRPGTLDDYCDPPPPRPCTPTPPPSERGHAPSGHPFGPRGVGRSPTDPKGGWASEPCCPNHCSAMRSAVQVGGEARSRGRLVGTKYCAGQRWAQTKMGTERGTATPYERPSTAAPAATCDGRRRWDG